MKVLHNNTSDQRSKAINFNIENYGVARHLPYAWRRRAMVITPSTAFEFIVPSVIENCAKWIKLNRNIL